VTTTTTEPAARVPLTERQREVYDAILTHLHNAGVPPTIRDLCFALDIRSPQGVVCHLKPLANKGWILWTPTSQPKGSARKRKKRKKATARGIVVPEVHEAMRAVLRGMLGIH